MSKRSSGHFLVLFDHTDRFDVASEPENPIKGHHGQSFLVWLRPHLEQAGYGVSEPNTEDWGWYMEVNDRSGGRFLLGATGLPWKDGTVDWTIQVRRWRTLSQWVRRVPVLRRDDPLLRLVERVLNELGLANVEVLEQEYRGLW